MLDASSPTFRQQYPIGATIYDRTGRRINGVVAFNQETGEVIRHGKSRIVGAILRMARGRQQRWDLPAEFWRHGFWPAPLTIRANWPLPPKHPMCRCVLEVLPDDTIVVIGITGPNEHFNGSYVVSSVNHNTITP